MEAHRAATAAALALHEGGYQPARAVDIDQGLAGAGGGRWHQPEVEREPAQSQHRVAAHGTVALVVQEQDAQVRVRQLARHQHSPVHVPVPPGLEHEPSPHVVEVLAHVALLGQQRGADHLRTPSQHDAQRLAARVHVHHRQSRRPRVMRRQPGHSRRARHRLSPDGESTTARPLALPAACPTASSPPEGQAAAPPERRGLRAETRKPEAGRGFGAVARVTRRRSRRGGFGPDVRALRPGRLIQEPLQGNLQAADGWVIAEVPGSIYPSLCFFPTLPALGLATAGGLWIAANPCPLLPAALGRAEVG